MALNINNRPYYVRAITKYDSGKTIEFDEFVREKVEIPSSVRYDGKNPFTITYLSCHKLTDTEKREGEAELEDAMSEPEFWT